jgi:hypothetical protein
MASSVILLKNMIEVMCSNKREYNWSQDFVTITNIMFSDESKLNLKFSDGSVRIYRRRRERFADGCAKETDRFGGGDVMVTPYL